MIIFGNKNLKKFLDTIITLDVADVAIKTSQIWIIPIYKVEISCTK